MEIILVLLGTVIGLGVMYFILRPKLTATKEIERNVEEENTQLIQKREELE
jgi:uncharacterized membrane protein YgaE (UPF0421/DUF939 family)